MELTPAAVLAFGSTVLYYNFHDISAKIDFSSFRAFKNSLRKDLLSTSELIIIGFCIALLITNAFLLHPDVLIIISLIAALSLLYSVPLIPFKGKWIRIREILYFKLSVVAFCWALMAVLLPVFEAGIGLREHILYIQLIAVGLFIFALCIPFEIRDVNLEKSRGLRTIPIVHGIRVARMSAVLALFLSVALYFYLYRINIISVYFFFSFLISALLSMLMISYSNNKPSDFYCKFYIDGLMIFQFLLVLLSLNFR
ncbi:MAG TPA: UbiA family prenyltransferase [Bacteroidia bacterium]|nr:UbiA family prenyltransferase [Bacteroidia bacterium]